MFEMIMTVLKQYDFVHGKYLFLKKSKNCFTNDRNKVHLPPMCVFYLLSVHLQHLEIFNKGFQVGVVSNTGKNGKEPINPTQI